MTSPAEEQLREALDALAGGVHPAPGAYIEVPREWRRRERRRRLILYILIAVVFACADVAGLWALNHANNQPHVIFNQPTSTQPHSPQTVLPRGGGYRGAA